MAKLKKRHKDNPKLEQRVLKDGRIALYLEYYLGRTETPVLDENGEPVLYTTGAMKGKPKYKVKHNRVKESLSLYLTAKPKTPIEKEENRVNMEMAQQIRLNKATEFLSGQHNIVRKKDKDINFYDWYDNFVASYTKTDKNKIRRAKELFIECMRETPEYVKYAKKIKPDQLTKGVIEAFTEYLQSRFNGETPHTLYARFKKVILVAVERDVIRKNPCKGVSIKIDKNKLTKDILSQEEIKTLIATHYDRENPNIRRAFIFCLYCGLRWCDVKDLTFGCVDYTNRFVRFEQAKTKGHSSASWVTIPLNDGLLNLIGTGAKDELIFPLPSHTMCLKALRHWVKRAGINKHITWHCGRHSFATNILSNGANIKTVASLLGHSDLRHTEKYTRAVDELKAAAINSLPTLDFN